MKTFLAASLGFLPLILFWTLAGAGHWTGAIAGGLTLAMLLTAWGWRSGALKSLEIGGLLTLALLALLYLMQPAFLMAHGVALSFALIGLFCLATVAAGRPWTSDYSRAAFASMANDVVFVRVNALISAVWGGIYLFYSVAIFAGWPWWSYVGATLAGKVVSIFGPKVLVRKLLEARTKGEESFRWPTPALSRAGGKGYDVAIIGAGIGGLTSAALLADAGAKVLVADQHVLPGGFCHHWPRKQRHNGVPRIFRFDSGVHDFSGVWPGGPIDRLSQRLGLEIDWLRLDHSYYLKGRRIDVPRDWRDYAALLGREFPDAAPGILALFTDLKAVFDGMYSTADESGGFPLGPRSVESMMAFPKAQPLAYEWMKKPFAELVARHVDDAGARKMLYALAGYITDTPSALTVGDMAPIFGYYFHGGFYPKCGSGVFSHALADAITARGGAVRLKSPVRQVLIDNGAARGIELASGEQVLADCVISNADLKRTFLDLVPGEALPRGFAEGIAALKPATSAFCVHLGVDFVPTGNPILHVERKGGGMGVMLPSIVDPTAAPEGYGTIELLRLMPMSEAEGWFRGDDVAARESWRRSAEYEAMKLAAGDEMIAAAETVFPDLRRHIVYRTDASPVTFARYDWSSLGSIYGVESAGVFKGSMSPVKGLYLAGAGNIGPGIEAVLIAGARTAEAIMPGLLAREPHRLAVAA